MSEIKSAIIDEICHRKTVLELTDVELDEWLNGIRERRLALIKEYKTKEAMKELIKIEKAKTEMERLFKILEKKITSIDKAFTAAEGYVSKIKALKLITERSK